MWSPRALLTFIGRRAGRVHFSLCVAEDDFIPLEVDVLDPHAEALEEPHSRAVEQRGHEPVKAAQMRQNGSDLFAGQDDGESDGLLGTDETAYPP